MTQTNAVGTKEITIKDFVDAAIRLEENYGLPIKEFRIHPDDWAVLKKQIKPFEVLNSVRHGQQISLHGMRLVIDEKAERL